MKLLGPSGADGRFGCHLFARRRARRNRGHRRKAAGLRPAHGPDRRQRAVKGSLQDIAFSPDGKRVAAGSLAGEIAIWDVARRSLVRTIHYKDAIVPIRFSPDGRTIATGDSTGRSSSGTRPPAAGSATLRGHNGWVLSVTFEPSGGELADQYRRERQDVGPKRGSSSANLSGADTGGRGSVLPERRTDCRGVRFGPRRRLERRSRRLEETGVPPRTPQPHASGVARLPSTSLPRCLLLSPRPPHPL